jgi:hypothetical protein
MGLMVMLDGNGSTEKQYKETAACRTGKNICADPRPLSLGDSWVPTIHNITDIAFAIFININFLFSGASICASFVTSRVDV